MFSISEIQDYHDHLDQHQDYITLMEEYSHLEIYKETIHFMDIAFPNWTTNRGIGFWAAEFVLTSIQNLEHLYNETNSSSFETLKELYLNLVDDYENSKSQFSFAISNKILKDFELEYNVLLDENEQLPKNDFNALYDDIFNSYKIKTLNKITYNFTDIEFSVI